MQSPAARITCNSTGICCTILDKHAIDTVIDVGANAGQFSLRGCALPDLPDASRHLSPFRRWPVRLPSDSPQIVCSRLIHCGLAEQDGAMELNVLAGSDFSSFLKTNENSEQYFPDRTGLKEIIEVPVRRLDGIEGIAQQESRLLLKLDTQGFDLQGVLGGNGLAATDQGRPDRVFGDPALRRNPWFHRITVGVRGGRIPAVRLFPGIARQDDSGDHRVRLHAGSWTSGYVAHP
jgi:hypothetical protein